MSKITEKIISIHEAYPNKTRSAIAKQVGCSRTYVVKTLSKYKNTQTFTISKQKIKEIEEKQKDYDVSCTIGECDTHPNPVRQCLYYITASVIILIALFALLFIA